MNPPPNRVPQPADMFTQINASLQAKLRGLRDAPAVQIIGEDGELHVRYAGQTYLQIDAVPDERVRALIRAAVAEWQARQR